MSAPRHAQHLLEARLATEDLAEAVLIERLHAVAESRRFDLTVGRSRLDARAHGVIDDENFSDAGAAAKAGVTAGRASGRNVHARRWWRVLMARERGLQTIQQRAIRRCRLGAVGTETADQTLS